MRSAFGRAEPRRRSSMSAGPSDVTVRLAGTLVVVGTWACRRPRVPVPGSVRILPSVSRGRAVGRALRAPRVVVVMPAYNAARTLVRTYRDIPPGVVDHVILVDDLSRDDTVAVAELLNLQVVVHRQNLGYGGNQKTCYDTALAEGADVVVMLHPDYQYDATRIPDLVAPILAGEADMVLGSRFLGDPLAGGMPRWKYVANRFLTTLQNRAYDLRLSEYHTGFRAYSRKLLETINYQANSNDFVFDQELVGQVVRAGFRIAEIPVPTRYFADVLYLHAGDPAAAVEFDESPEATPCAMTQEVASLASPS